MNNNNNKNKNKRREEKRAEASKSEASEARYAQRWVWNVSRVSENSNRLAGSQRPAPVCARSSACACAQSQSSTGSV